MGEKEKMKIRDVVRAEISPPMNGGKEKNDYGGILSATTENIHQVADIAVMMKDQTPDKPIMIVLGGKNG